MSTLPAPARACTLKHLKWVRCFGGGTKIGRQSSPSFGFMFPWRPFPPIKIDRCLLPRFLSQARSVHLRAFRRLSSSTTSPRPTFINTDFCKQSKTSARNGSIQQTVQLGSGSIPRRQCSRGRGHDDKMTTTTTTPTQFIPEGLSAALLKKNTSVGVSRQNGRQFESFLGKNKFSHRLGQTRELIRVETAKPHCSSRFGDDDNDMEAGRVTPFSAARPK